MRLWTIHPVYLDRQGLLGLWREGLLARAVLRGQTRGYRHHPQLDRFRDDPTMIEDYLHVIVDEAERRGYRFDRTKLDARACRRQCIDVSCGQVEYERRHLAQKLRDRHHPTAEVGAQIHPLFRVVPGVGCEAWERTT